jgi:hypothetical protein
MFRQAFTAHPRTVGETYLQHQRQAFYYAGSLFLAGMAAIVHGLVPCLFEHTASHMVARLQARMAARRVP